MPYAPPFPSALILQSEYWGQSKTGLPLGEANHAPSGNGVQYFESVVAQVDIGLGIVESDTATSEAEAADEVGWWSWGWREIGISL